jgi:hypothetical protein
MHGLGLSKSVAYQYVVDRFGVKAPRITKKKADDEDDADEDDKKKKKKAKKVPVSSAQIAQQKARFETGVVFVQKEKTSPDARLISGFVPIHSMIELLESTDRKIKTLMTKRDLDSKDTEKIDPSVSDKEVGLVVLTLLAAEEASTKYAKEIQTEFQQKGHLKKVFDAPYFDCFGAMIELSPQMKAISWMNRFVDVADTSNLKLSELDIWNAPKSDEEDADDVDARECDPLKCIFDTVLVYKTCNTLKATAAAPVEEEKKKTTDTAKPPPSQKKKESVAAAAASVTDKKATTVDSKKEALVPKKQKPAPVVAVAAATATDDDSEETTTITMNDEEDADGAESKATTTATTVPLPVDENGTAEPSSSNGTSETATTDEIHPTQMDVAE